MITSAPSVAFRGRRSQLQVDPSPTQVRQICGDLPRQDFARTGLRLPSTLRLHRLMTASTSLIHRELGSLSPAYLAAVQFRLRQLFGSS
jgi:mRNA interferase MazF